MNALPQRSISRFRIGGVVVPLLATMAKAVDARSTRSRPMGGWLMTYGHVGPDGGIVPTVDRDGHIFEAARELGLIDWSRYMKGGKWNDTHRSEIIVGLPSTLEFHDGTTELSKAHGKLGFWTTGWLFDRDDPGSWEGLTDPMGYPRRPTAHEFERADHFWNLATLLKGLPRGLGLSAEGGMLLSPCGSRIIYAEVDDAAVCEVPVNPDATLDFMAKAITDIADTPLALMRKGMLSRSPCGRCSCPPDACKKLRLLDKATPFTAVERPDPHQDQGPGPDDATPSEARVAPEGDGDEVEEVEAFPPHLRAKVLALMRRLCESLNISPRQAANIVRTRLQAHQVGDIRRS